MTFELLEPTEVKITEVKVLSSKDRKPTDNPGAKLNIIVALSNAMLAMLDGSMRSALYTAVPGSAHESPDSKPQGALVAEVQNTQIVSDMPKLTGMGQHLKEFGWNLEIIGATLNIEYGTNGPSGITATGCKVSSFRLFCQEGGVVILKFVIETGDVDITTHGKLAMLKNLKAVITLEAPKAADAKPTNPLPFEADGSQNVAGSNVTKLKTGGKAAAAPGTDDGAGTEGKPLSVEQAFEAAGAQ